MPDLLTLYLWYLYISLTVISLALIIGSLLVFRKNRSSTQTATNPCISIIIAAKNEAQNLRKLIQALASQTASVPSFEVIIVDDHSSDSTSRVLQSLAIEYPWLTPLSLSEVKGSGKRAALSYGISKAKYEFVGITDADCLPGAEWIESLQRAFASSHGFVFGPAVSDMTGNYISKIGSFENFNGSLLIYFAAFIGKPFSARAANFGFPKQLFYDLGGYTGIGESLSGDDDLLIREAFKSGIQVDFFTNLAGAVRYYHKKNLLDYLRQKARHTSSSHHYLLSHKLALTFWHGINIFAQWAFIFTAFSPFFGYLTVVKMIVEFVKTSLLQKYFGYNFSFLDKLVLPFIYEFFIEVNFIYSFFRKSKW